MNMNGDFMCKIYFCGLFKKNGIKLGESLKLEVGSWEKWRNTKCKDQKYKYSIVDSDPKRWLNAT